MPPPLVSVLMAARNHASFVADAVASVLDQDYERLELIAIDDASDDETADVLERCASVAAPGRMRVVRHEHQEGIAATRAQALNLASGQFIGLLDSDDLWLPGKVRRQVELLETRPEVGLTHAAFEAFNSDTGERVPWDPVWKQDADQLVELFRVGCFIMTGTVLIRRAAIEERGVSFVSLNYPSYDDYLLYLSIALDWQFAYESRTVMLYRRHTGNLTNVLFSQNIARARLNLLRAFLRIFPDAKKRLGSERRRVFALLLIRAAYHDRTHHPIRAARWALSGFAHGPAVAAREADGLAHSWLAERRRQADR